jgi:import inner membrane translocase subunit TIM23
MATLAMDQSRSHSQSDPGFSASFPKTSSASGNALFGLLSNLKTPPGVPSDQQLEFLFEDEYKPNGPSWGARICYGAGTTYLSGLALGGSWGLFDGLRNPVGKGSRRLRINSIVNACTARGPFVANNLGMLALLYNLIHGGVIHLRDGKFDEASAIGSAAAAGLVYKSTAGLPKAVGAAGVFGAVMAAYQLGLAYRDRKGPFANL